MTSLAYVAILILGILTLFWQLFVTFKKIWRLIDPNYVILVDSNIASIGQSLQGIIDKYAPDTANYNLVELGCGRAVVTQHLANSNNFKKILAIDSESNIIAAAKKLKPNPKIEFLVEDIFKFQSPKSSIIYCYLFPRIMSRLYIERRLEGNLIISLTFPIKGVEPTEIILIENLPRLRFTQCEIFVYDFRTKNHPEGSLS